MNYALEMGSGAMMYITRFIKIASCIQTLLGVMQIQRDGHTDTAR
jgi:hypothetical protein